ncbi:MAG: hypothetical protein CML68_21005 [Rhodobacteraceae bacterium]|nr:hypothetical protein [Paracoccaceae bacterium]
MFRLLTTLCLLLAALPATAQDNPIVAQLTAFAEAYNAGNAQAIVTFYTDDAALLPQQSHALIGHEAIGGHYAAAFASGAGNLRLDVQEIRQHGPSAAVEIGETLIDIDDTTIRGRYLHVWTLTDDGWLLSRDMYHVLAVGQPG